MKEVFAQYLKDKGFSEPLILALQGVIDKESGWIPKVETNYTNTSNDRIRSVFPSIFGSKNDTFIDIVKEDPETFFNTVYGSKFGNSAYEGYKYRGRGLNQLTFKDNYKRIGDLIGVDLVTDPDKILQGDIPAKAAAAFFVNAFKGKNVNITDYPTAIATAVMANAGFPAKTNSVINEGIKKVTDYVEANKKKV